MHWKKSLLVIHKILRLFASTLIVDDKHYLLNRDNLTQPIQMQLYQKQINIVKLVALEKVSFSDTQNPKTVC